MDEAGFETAHLVGNSLGGYVSLQLASRGRAQTVVALAPAGGWAQGEESYKDTLRLLHDDAGPAEERRAARGGGPGLHRGPPWRDARHRRATARDAEGARPRALPARPAPASTRSNEPGFFHWLP